MIPYGKGRRYDQGNYGGNLPSGSSPPLNASTTPVTEIQETLSTTRGLKSPWYEGPVAEVDWHGFYFNNQNTWEPFFNDKKVSFDIGIGPVGSEQRIVQDICSDMPSHMRSAQGLFIPMHIPKGTTIQVRAMLYADTTSGDYYLRPMFLGICQPMEYQRIFHRSETIGIQTVGSPVLGNGYGTLCDATVINTWTSWVSLGTTTFDWHTCYLQVGHGYNGVDPDLTASAGPYQGMYQVGFGSSQDIIWDAGYVTMDDILSGGSDWTGGGHLQLDPLHKYIPSGTEVFVRYQTTNITDVGCRKKDFRMIGFG
jgi:hypothetical protein